MSLRNVQNDLREIRRKMDESPQPQALATNDLLCHRASAGLHFEPGSATASRCCCAAATGLPPVEWQVIRRSTGTTAALFYSTQA